MTGNKTSQAKEQILSKIRTALRENALPIPFPEADKWDPKDAFEKSNLSNDELFAENFVGLGGKYVYCDNEQELLENISGLYEQKAWNKLFCSNKRLLQICQNNKLDFVQAADNTDESADACISDCDALVARTGSFIMSSQQHLGRVSSIFYPVHIVVAYAADLVYDVEDGFARVQQKYPNTEASMISLQTGPSRTADIEKTLVTGVHGPKEVFCFFVNA